MDLIKKYKIITFPSFENELDEIYNYLLKILNEPNIANKFHKKFLKQIKSLQYFPERNIKIFSKRNKNLRRLLIDNYSIIYEVKRNTRTSFYITYFSL